MFNNPSLSRLKLTKFWLSSIYIPQNVYYIKSTYLRRINVTALRRYLCKKFFHRFQWRSRLCDDFHYFTIWKIAILSHDCHEFSNLHWVRLALKHSIHIHQLTHIFLYMKTFHMIGTWRFETWPPNKVSSVDKVTLWVSL